MGTVVFCHWWDFHNTSIWIRMVLDQWEKLIRMRNITGNYGHSAECSTFNFLAKCMIQHDPMRACSCAKSCITGSKSWIQNKVNLEIVAILNFTIVLKYPCCWTPPYSRLSNCKFPSFEMLFSANLASIIQHTQDIQAMYNIKGTMEHNKTSTAKPHVFLAFLPFETSKLCGAQILPIRGMKLTTGNITVPHHTTIKINTNTCCT